MTTKRLNRYGIYAFCLVISFCSLISSCANQPSTATDFAVESDRLVLVNFASKAEVNSWQTSQNYTYASQNWRRPLGIHRPIQELEAEYSISVVDEWPIDSLELYCVVFAIPDNQSADSILEQLNADDRIAFAEPMETFELLTASSAKPLLDNASGISEVQEEAQFLNDPLLGVQHPNTFSWLQELHVMSTGSSVRVGIIDSGIDTKHPDLLGRLRAKRSLLNDNLTSSFEHGTAVAGIIGAIAGNQEGIAGLVPDANLYSYESCGALNGSTFCDSFTLAKALEYALRDKLHVLNLSLAGPKTPLLEALINQHLQAGTIIVAAQSANIRQGFPANIEGVISVNSEMANGFWFANEEQFTTEAGGGYRFFYGTSMSAAAVTGFSAALASEYEKSKVMAIMQSLSRNDCDDDLFQIISETPLAQKVIDRLCHPDAHFFSATTSTL